MVLVVYMMDFDYSQTTHQRQQVANLFVVAWSIAGSSILPQLYIDISTVFLMLSCCKKKKKNKTNDTTTPDVEYGGGGGGGGGYRTGSLNVSQRYGRRRGSYLVVAVARLLQSIFFGCGCTFMGFADKRSLLDPSSPSSSSSTSTGTDGTNNDTTTTTTSTTIIIEDRTVFYLLAGCCMTLSALLAFIATGRGCCSCYPCCYQRSAHTINDDDGGDVNDGDGGSRGRRCGQTMAIVGNGLLLGPSLLLIFTYAVGGWCGQCFLGFFVQFGVYLFWIAASVCWFVADCSLKVPKKTKRDSDHQQATQNRTSHDNDQDPTLSVADEIEIP
mmetsp:Transcript_9985/g.24121  ORF Transcript_9985/g.24121 Transcript_9985/m.24121 type:complete len:328 (-) Transcript_9985:206-1189(-)|eukprot:CAMPEP_0113475922 /NCGR_PEP_ID=MMETSP0014_2-20120614/19384_1 /TAXON_ID=2857 /ORGANISM="Nitzschia sp." /LENGTH=327 /DNA_ID=CAMNT_0000368885 /DNA_START=412 /DNA_END=1395 /DNA_ORIENTATION=+ /assembly_acc=CAM_ASM_000159